MARLCLQKQKSRICIKIRIVHIQFSHQGIEEQSECTLPGASSLNTVYPVVQWKQNIAVATSKLEGSGERRGRGWKCEVCVGWGNSCIAVILSRDRDGLSVKKLWKKYTKVIFFPSHRREKKSRERVWGLWGWCGRDGCHLIVRVDLARQMSPNSNHTTCIFPEAARLSKTLSRYIWRCVWRLDRGPAEE